MPGSFISNDLNTLFASSEFGEANGSVTWKGDAIEYGIFDDDDVEIQIGEGVTEISPRAMFTGRASDFAGIADGDPMVIGGVNFKVKFWKNDGTGVIEIYLEKI